MTSTEPDHIAFLRPKSEEAVSSVQSSLNSRFLTHFTDTAQIALRFSKGPRDWTTGFVFGRQQSRCDVLLSGDGISRRHFCIAINPGNGNPVLADVSSSGTIVESRANGRTHVHNTSIAIFTGDIIQAGLSMFMVEIPLYTEQNRETYLRNVLASLPSLDGLCIQKDPQFTMQVQGKLSLVTDSKETASGLRKAVDYRGDFYAIQVRPKREKSCWDKNISHAHLVLMFPEKFLDLSIERLVTEWPTHGTLAEQTLVSAREMMIILQQILEATACIHEHNIVHRGIEPSNIWIMSRRPMNCKLGGFSSTATSAYLATEVHSRKSYLYDDYPADIWSIGLTVLRYSLFGRWYMRTSKWSVEPCIEAQSPRPDPGWHTLTGLANAMLQFDVLNRPSAKDCLKQISTQNKDATIIDGAKQASTNIDFLSCQKNIPGVSAQIMVLILDLDGEVPKTVNIRKAHSILKIPQTGWKEAQRITLLGLATLLEGLDDMSAQTDAVYIRNLQKYVEDVHLAEISGTVFVLHDISDQEAGLDLN